MGAYRHIQLMALIGGVSLFFAACAQIDSHSQIPEARARVVEHLGPMVKMERRGAELTMVMQNLPRLAKVTPIDAQQLREHYNVYFVFHDAATVSLAQGNIPAYRDQVKAASAELDSLEAKLKDMVKQSSVHGN